MNSILDRQVSVDLFTNQNDFYFRLGEQYFVLPSIDKVHEFFQKQPFDTVKFFHEDKKTYVHFNLADVEVFDSKRDLRRILSQENSGAWIEEKNGKRRYFVDDSGWFQTSFKKVSKEDYLQRMDSPSTMQKVLGLGLGLLALLPGALEIKERLPFGASEAGMGLLALQQKSPLLGALGCSLLPSSVEAQAVGTEFQVNTYTVSNQDGPAVAPFSNGGFVVVWESLGQGGGARNIFGQKYHPDGSENGSEFQINTYTTSFQQSPAVAPMNDGGFVVTWQSDGQDGDSRGVIGKRYDSRGMVLGTEFLINTYTNSSQDAPSVAGYLNGGFVTTWTSENQTGEYSGIFGQRYDSNSSNIGSEFQINTNTTFNKDHSSVATLSNNGFVVCWQSEEQDVSRDEIFAQLYNTDGIPIGLEFQVNTYISSWQQRPNIAALRDDGFVIVWQSSGQDNSSWGIFAQKYFNNGTSNRIEFQVNNHTTYRQDYPNIASLANGGFVIVWQSDGQDESGDGIFGQRYDANNAPIGLEFQVNTYTFGSQQLPRVAPLSDGGFVVIWESWGQDGDGRGIFGQRFDQNGNPVPLAHQDSTNSSFIPTNSPSQLTFSANEGTSISMISNGASSIRSNFQIPVLIDVVYDNSYSITQNGQTIGTFTISGGTGPYSGSNPNTLNIEINPDILLQDGDTVTLFSVPEGEALQWESITFVNSDGCFNAEGELVRNEENNGSDYQLVFGFEGESCTIYGGASKFGAIPVLTSGGLI